MRVPFTTGLLGLAALLALILLPSCKKRFDGTCKVDKDCLEFQKCASGVCVRAKPIFEAYVPPPAAPAPEPKKRPAKAPLQSQPTEEPEPEAKPPAPAPRPDLGPAVPKTPRDPKTARTFRLDA